MQPAILWFAIWTISECDFTITWAAEWVASFSTVNYRFGWGAVNTSFAIIIADQARIKINAWMLNVAQMLMLARIPFNLAVLTFPEAPRLYFFNVAMNELPTTIIAPVPIRWRRKTNWNVCRSIVTTSWWLMVGLTWVPSSYPPWEDIAPFAAALDCHQRPGRDLDTLLTLEAEGCTKQERPLQKSLSI